MADYFSWFAPGGGLAVLALATGFLFGGTLMYLLARHGRAQRNSERQRAEQLRVMFEDAVAALDDGFVLYDSDDRMYICNEPFRQQFGAARRILDHPLTYREQLYQLADSGIVPGIEDKKEEFVQTLLKKRQSEFGVTKVFQTHDGRWIRQRDKKTASGNIVGLRTDVTELKQQELALTEACEKAKAAAQAKSTFLANMSHEIRTPMNGIIGMAELLEETRLDDEQRMCTRTVIQSCNALLTLVNDILDFSKVDSGKMELHEEPFDLLNCVYGVATLLAPKANEKGVEICLDIPEHLAGWYLGDEGRLRQILINLVGNAVKFTEQGHILIELCSDQATDRITLQVSDTGIGIPAPKLGEVFAAFEQVDSASTRQYDGTGLGLAITRKLTELMGGSIEVQSELGRGSCFTVTLPLTECAPQGEEIEVPEGNLLPGLRALVVDDLEVNRLVLQRNLANWGMRCTLAASAAEALDILRAGHRFDIAIFDFQMPKMDGYALMAEVRKDPQIEIGSTVLLSSVDSGFAATKLAQIGFDAALLKPVRASRLRQVLHRVLYNQGAPMTRPDLASPFSAHDLRGQRILIAEDNRTNQMVLSKILKKYGAELDVCSNGREALHRFKQQRPDLVLMDISMPVMNGLQATTKLRRWEQKTGARPVPVIALTANAVSEDRDRCLDQGMDGFLCKPVRKDKLLQTIEDHLALQPIPAKAAQP